MIDNKREKLFYSIAYIAITILTLLPFFHIGIANDDDFLFFLVAHKDLAYWKFDAEVYAQGQGRFYYLFTKYFYYFPYLFDNFAWTKFVQYSSLCVCYLLFSYLVYRIFKSKKLSVLSLLLLVFNTSVGYYSGYNIPIGFPFYFTCSFIVFLSGLLLFIDFVEKGKPWQLLLSAVLFFVAFLFYEVYLVFALLFFCCVVVRNWKRFGFSKMWKTKSFYVELVPYVSAFFLYLVCYFGYRYYLAHKLGLDPQYSGAKTAAHLNMGTFFKVLGNLSFYNVPGRIYAIDETKRLVAENSLLPGGHVDSLWFMLTHSPAVAYVNALIQCGILWFLLKRHEFGKISWKSVVVAALVALVFAVSANILIAATEKYNGEWAINMKAYVTSFFSYFGVMLTIALLMVSTLKLARSAALQKVLCVAWCAVLFGFSVVNYYVNDHLSRAWMKSENRITMLRLINDEGFFKGLPDNAVIYTEKLHHTSEHGQLICHRNNNFEEFITQLVGQSKGFHFAYKPVDLQELAMEFPDAPLYFLQATESKKGCELMMCFSHISHLDTADISLSTADHSDVFYYSPTKEYLLFYRTNANTDSAKVKSLSVIADNKRQKVVQAAVKDEGLDPFGFSISNMCVSTADTIRVPASVR